MTKPDDIREFGKTVTKLIWAFTNADRRESYRRDRREHVESMRGQYRRAGMPHDFTTYRDLYPEGPLPCSESNQH